ncbi:MAG: phosphate/phosphite/phosphonate ABC transporter substrate-binding protein [Limisphaerales bacterium]
MNQPPSNLQNARPALAVLALALLLGLAVFPGLAAEPATPPRQARLRLLFANSLIQNVNRNDVLAAFKLWVETVGRNRGFLLEAEPESFDRIEEVEKRLREKTLDLVILPTTDYLRLTASGPLEPVFSPARSQKIPFDDYVLVTRRDRNFSDLPALRGKSVAFYQYGGNQGRRWMEVLLGESGLGPVHDFFGAQSDLTKASAVVLPVFFGKFDCAVVNRSGLDTMKEMNPQLEAHLQVLTHSRPLPESVICLHQDYTEVRADLLAGLADLHTEPRGQQILLVFKIAQLMPFQPEYLDGVRDLQARQRKLAAPAEAKTAAALAGAEPMP